MVRKQIPSYYVSDGTINVKVEENRTDHIEHMIVYHIDHITFMLFERQIFEFSYFLRLDIFYGRTGYEDISGSAWRLLCSL